jgi:hypothetical protein
MATKWKEISDRDDALGDAMRGVETTGKWMKPKAERISADGLMGGKYAVTHLHESPTDLALAGAEHYRNYPLVSNERRAKWLIDQQPTRSMSEGEIAGRMGWSKRKTREVTTSLESSGHAEVYETSRGNIVMSRDGIGNPQADYSETSPQPSDRLRRNDR